CAVWGGARRAAQWQRRSKSTLFSRTIEGLCARRPACKIRAARGAAVDVAEIAAALGTLEGPAQQRHQQLGIEAPAAMDAVPAAVDQLSMPEGGISCRVSTQDRDFKARS